MPFWSAESRALRIIEQVETYQGYEVVSLPLDVWRSRWLPGLAKDGLLVGLNWSGSSATGYDVTPVDAEAGLVARMKRRARRAAVADGCQTAPSSGCEPGGFA